MYNNIQKWLDKHAKSRRVSRDDIELTNCVDMNCKSAKNCGYFHNYYTAREVNIADKKYNRILIGGQYKCRYFIINHEITEETLKAYHENAITMNFYKDAMFDDGYFWEYLGYIYVNKVLVLLYDDHSIVATGKKFPIITNVVSETLVNENRIKYVKLYRFIAKLGYYIELNVNFILKMIYFDKTCPGYLKLIPFGLKQITRTIPQMVSSQKEDTKDEISIELV